MKFTLISQFPEDIKTITDKIEELFKIFGDSSQHDLIISTYHKDTKLELEETQRFKFINKFFFPSEMIREIEELYNFKLVGIEPTKDHESVCLTFMRRQNQ